MGKYLLSIDGATHISGWSIVDIDSFDLIDYGQIEISSKDEPIMRNRVIYMIDKIKEILDNNKIDQIVMEDVPPAINNSATVLALGILSGGVLGLAHSKNIPIDYITVPYWHSELGILKSNGDLKEQSIKWVNDKYGLDLIYVSPKSSKNMDNLSDPIAFGCVYLGNYVKIEKKRLCRKK